MTSAAETSQQSAKAATLSGIEASYRADFHRFLRVAEAVTGELDTARDSVQEAFANAIRYRHTFRAGGDLRSWLWSCVVNAARRERSERLRTPLPVADLGADASQPLTGNDRITHAIAELPDRQRLVLFLRYYADLDYRTIGYVLGIETGTVSATLHAAHQTLRRSLKEVP
jgi:RNA polymerase sigma-70 factor (ECF subfamily)